MMDKETLSHCRRLISTGNLDECLHLLLEQYGQSNHPHSNDLSLLSAQYQAFVRDKSMGHSTDPTTINRITRAVLDIISSEDVTEKLIAGKNSSQLFPPQYWFWGGTLLIIVLVIVRISRPDQTNGAQSPIIHGNNIEMQFGQKDTLQHHAKE